MSKIIIINTVLSRKVTDDATRLARFQELITFGF